MRSESDGAETEAEVRSLVGGLSTPGFLDYMAVAAGGDSKVTLQQYAKQVCALGMCVLARAGVCATGRCVHWVCVSGACACSCLFVCKGKVCVRVCRVCVLVRAGVCALGRCVRRVCVSSVCARALRVVCAGICMGVWLCLALLLHHVVTCAHDVRG